MDVCIVLRHRDIDSPNLPARCSHSCGHFGLLAGAQLLTITVDLIERRTPDQRVSAARCALPGGRIPFLVTHAVVDRRIRVRFETAAANHGDFGLIPKEVQRRRQPLRLQDAVTVKKLHEVALGGSLQQLPIASVSAARGGERAVIGECDDRRAEPFSQSSASIGRTRIGVNDSICHCEHRAEASFEPRPFVSADDDEADGCQRQRRQGITDPDRAWTPLPVAPVLGVSCRDLP